jgi:hypothetical protein
MGLTTDVICSTFSAPRFSDHRLKSRIKVKLGARVMIMVRVRLRDRVKVRVSLTTTLYRNFGLRDGSLCGLLVRNEGWGYG